MPHLPCAVCSKTFYRCPAHLKRDGNPIATCSHKCAGSLKRGQNNPAFNGGPESRSCQWCSKEFLRNRGEMTNGRGRFCSKECQDKANTGAGSPRFKGYADRPCFNCSKPVKTQSQLHLDQPRRFCSLKCVGLVKRQELKGQGNGRYVHGEAYNRYSATFRAVAKLVRTRDENTCQLCHATAEQTGVRLDVHHVDYDKEHNVESNLVGLCHYCHGSMHGSKASREFWRSAWCVYLVEKYGYAIN